MWKLVLGSLGLVLVLAGPLRSQTFVVDDDGGPGVDFTDLPDAVAAAPQGAVLLVRSGSYSSFVLSKGLTILGTAPGVVIAPGTRIFSLPAGRRVVLAALEPRDLVVEACAGTVVLDQVTLPHPSQTTAGRLLRVERCADVRVQGSTFGLSGMEFTGRAGIGIRTSRVELVSTTVRGDSGQTTFCGPGLPGGEAVFLESGGRVHVVASDLSGGIGGPVYSLCGSECNLGAGPGGSALRLLGWASRAILAGPPGNRLEGGFAGDGQECHCDGPPGAALLVVGGLASHSGLELVGGETYCYGNGSAVVTSSGGAYVPEASAMPYLTLAFVPAPGAQVRFDVAGEPGDQVALILGRHPVVQALPGVEIERLITEERVLSMGPVGAEGNVNLLLTIPANLPAGFTFHAQARVQRAGAELRTNSLALVLR